MSAYKTFPSQRAGLPSRELRSPWRAILVAPSEINAIAFDPLNFGDKSA